MLLKAEIGRNILFAVKPGSNGIAGVMNKDKTSMKKFASLSTYLSKTSLQERLIPRSHPKNAGIGQLTMVKKTRNAVISGSNSIPSSVTTSLKKAKLFVGLLTKESKTTMKVVRI